MATAPPAPPRSKGAEFVLAGASACAAITLINPVDVVKTRLQLQGELAERGAGPGGAAYRGVAQALWRIGTTEGPRGLQRGLCAAWLLQFSNVGCRFGCYDLLKSALGVRPGESSMPSLLALAGCSGAVAGLVSNPFFLLKTRFQAAGSEDVRHQHETPTIRGAFADIGRKDGPRGYWRGTSAFVPRVMAASSVQLATYDECKLLIARLTGAPDGVPTHFGAAMLAGIAVTLAMQPFDIVAVRLMNQRVGEQGAGELYSGPVDCAAKTLRSEGPAGLFKGTLASYLRFGPYCVLTFVFLEEARRQWDRRLGTAWG